jgi:hypothetical protein
MLQVAPQIVGQQLPVTVLELIAKACRMRGFRRQWLAFKHMKCRTAMRRLPNASIKAASSTCAPVRHESSRLPVSSRPACPH